MNPTRPAVWSTLILNWLWPEKSLSKPDLKLTTTNHRPDQTRPVKSLMVVLIRAGCVNQMTVIHHQYQLVSSKKWSNIKFKFHLAEGLLLLKDWTEVLQTVENGLFGLVLRNKICGGSITADHCGRGNCVWNVMSEKSRCKIYCTVLSEFSSAPQHKTKEQHCNNLLFFTQLYLSVSCRFLLPIFPYDNSSPVTYDWSSR